MATEPRAFDGFTEPESAANTDYQPVYPYNNVTQTPSGHLFEMDDTPTRERVRLQHRSKTFIEMHPNGDQVHKIYGNGYTITLGDHNIAIGVDNGENANKCNITIYGDVNLNVKGDFYQEVDGNYSLHVKGRYTQTVDKTSSIVSAGDMRITAGASATGALRITTGDHVYVDGDLSVDGEMIATKITSTTRVDAGVGIGAGLAGVVSLGGISVGGAIPAIPGTITATVSVLAPVVMGTNMVYGSILMDPTGGAPLMRSIYDSHAHISSSPGSPTSLPLALMPLP
jgi:hypothetical protein